MKVNHDDPFPDPWKDDTPQKIKKTRASQDEENLSNSDNGEHLHRNSPDSFYEDMRDIWKKVQSFTGMLDKHHKGNSPNKMRPAFAIVIVLGVFALWLSSGFYRVLPDEQGIILRFGQYVRTTHEGLNYHLPYPIETVYRPKVTYVNQISIGMVASPSRKVVNDLPDETLMLTGDENIVDVDFRVFWIIKNAPHYLFNVSHPEKVLKTLAESIMRSVIGQHKLQEVLTEERQVIENTVRQRMQEATDAYGLGVEIQQVKMQKSDPPDAVISSFRDVQAARADQERARNEAKLYANKVIPEARGRAATLTQEAEAYRNSAIAQGQGEAERFLSIYREYLEAPQVTRERLYLETMEEFLESAPKVIIQKKGGVIPYLPLDALKMKGKQ